jgi:hypothetical protein
MGMKQKTYNKKAIKRSGGQWKPRTNENSMLQKYWLRVEATGDVVKLFKK